MDSPRCNGCAVLDAHNWVLFVLAWKYFRVPKGKQLKEIIYFSSLFFIFNSYFYQFQYAFFNFTPTDFPVRF
jgi:hypothetical protein